MVVQELNRYVRLYPLEIVGVDVTVGVWVFVGVLVGVIGIVGVTVGVFVGVGVGVVIISWHVGQSM